MSTPEIRVPCAEDRKWKVVEAIRARQSVAGTAIDAIDGVRVRQGSGWWLLRASNTQDILVVRCEAATRKHLDEIMDFLRRELADRSAEHTSELQSLMRISYAVFCLNKKKEKDIQR